jgi:hypothetical protein
VIADLVVTIAIYRSGGRYLAVCHELGIEGTGTSPDDAREEALAAAGRYLDIVAARGELGSILADAGFVVDGGALRAERRLIGIEEGRVTVPF